ncbi:hypothetical protein BJF80_09525 [Serinicoccus sp. CUA-874]|nr:hypothetical protein BJF80_09525 [Serinicoccus sp. CUA-874]
MSSTALWAGVTGRSPAFWSQALTSQSAASAAGCVPPTTNPKKRPEAVAVSPASLASASNATASSGGQPRCGSSGPSAATTSSMDACGGTGRSPSEPSQSRACSCATSSARE